MAFIIKGYSRLKISLKQQLCPNGAAVPLMQQGSGSSVLHFRVVTCMGEPCLVQIQDNIWEFEKNLVQKFHCGSMRPPLVDFHRKAKEAKLLPSAPQQ